MVRFRVALFLCLFLFPVSYSVAEEEYDPYGFIQSPSIQELFNAAAEVSSGAYLTADLVPYLESAPCISESGGFVEIETSIAEGYTQLLHFRETVEAVYSGVTWLWMSLGGDIPSAYFESYETFERSWFAVSDRANLTTAIASFGARCPNASVLTADFDVDSNFEAGIAEVEEFISTAPDACAQLYVDLHQAWVDYDNLELVIQSAKQELENLKSRKSATEALQPTTNQGKSAKETRLIVINAEISYQNRVLTKATTDKTAAGIYAGKLKERYIRDCKDRQA